jgi:hypothetical protein
MTCGYMVIDRTEDHLAPRRFRIFLQVKGMGTPGDGLDADDFFAAGLAIGWGESAVGVLGVAR